MQQLYRFEREARKALTASGKSGYKSTADAGRLEVMDERLRRGGVAGEVNCYRTADGDIFAWWE